jgi:hypothetical protein
MPTLPVGIAPMLATCQIRSPIQAFENTFPLLSPLVSCLDLTSSRTQTFSVLPVFTSWQVRSYGVGARIRYNIEQPSRILVLND